jgi:hypothetical protein
MIGSEFRMRTPNGPGFMRTALRHASATILTATTSAAIIAAMGCWRSAHEVRMEHQPEAALTLELARAEIAELSEHPWAGEYRTRSNLVGDRVILAPDSGIVSDPWMDFPIAGSMNSGRIVAVTQNSIHVEFVLPRGESREKPYLAELVRIRWGERRYLVWREYLGGFRDEVRRLVDPEGQFRWAMLHQADMAKPAGSLEELVGALEAAIARGTP